MPSITKAAPQQRETIDQFVERDQARRAFERTNAQGILGSLEAAAGTTLTRDLAWAWAGRDFPAEEGFVLTSKLLDTLKQDVDEDLWPSFAGVRSSEHALLVRANLLDLSERRRTIAASGVTGSAASILANVFDPVTLGAGFATGGLGSIAGTTAKLTKSAMAIRGATSGVGAGIVTGAIRQEVSPTARGADFAQDIALGATLGAFGAAGRGLNRVQRFTAGGAIGGTTNLAVEAGNAMITDNDEALTMAGVGQAFLLFGTLAALPRTVAPPIDTIISKNDDARVAMNKSVAEVGMRMLPAPPVRRQLGPSTLNDRTPDGAIRARGKVPLALPERATPPNRANDPIPTVRVIDTDGVTVIELPAEQKPARVGDRQKVRNYARSLLDANKFDETSIDEISAATGIPKDRVAKWAAPVVDFVRTQKQDVDLAGPLINEQPKRSADQAAAIANLDWQDDLAAPIGMFIGLDDVIAQAMDAPLPNTRAIPIPEPVTLAGERLNQANAIQDEFDLQARAEVMGGEQSRLADAEVDPATLARFTQSGTSGESLGVELPAARPVVDAPSPTTSKKSQGIPETEIFDDGEIDPSNTYAQAIDEAKTYLNEAGESAFDSRASEVATYSAIGDIAKNYNVDPEELIAEVVWKQPGQRAMPRLVENDTSPTQTADQTAQPQPARNQQVNNQDDGSVVSQGDENRTTVAQAVANAKAKRARGRAQFKTPGGSRPGTLATGEILDAAYQAAATVLRGGVKSAQAIADAVEVVVNFSGVRIAEYKEAKAKILTQTKGWVNAHNSEADLTTSYTLASVQPPPDLRTQDRGAMGLYLDEITDAPSTWTNPITVLNPVSSGKFVGGMTRWDTTALLARNPDPLIRWNSNAVGYDAMPKTDGRGTFSMSEFVLASRKAAYSQSTRGFDQAYDTYVLAAKQQGKKPIDALTYEDLPTHYIRGDKARIPAELMDSVKEAAKVFEASRAYHVDMAVKHGVAEAAQYKDPTYMPREWVGEKFDSVIASKGMEAVEDVLAGAISKRRFLNTNSQIVPGKQYNNVELALGRAIIRHAMRNPDQTLGVMGDILDVNHVDDLVSILQSEGISPEIIDSIKYRVTTDPTQPGVSKNLKNRIDMDELHSITLPDGSTLAVSDLLNNNIRHLEERLHQRLITASALAELHYQFVRRQNQVLGKDMSDYVPEATAKIPSDIISRIKAMSKNPNDPLFVSGIDDLEYLIKLGAQIPVRRTTNTTRVFSTLKSLLNMKSLTGLGSAIQNLSDASDALAIGGARIFMNRLPALVDTISTMRKGIMKPGLMREIQAFGLGVDFINGRVRPMVDTDTGGYINLQNDTMGKVQRGSNQASRGALSIFSAVNEGVRRMTSQVLIDRLYDYGKIDAGKTGSKPSMSAKRLLDLGMDEAQWKAVAADIAQHSTVEQGWLGEKVASLNLEKWDPRNAARLRAAVNRLYNVAVTESNPTAKSRWMTSDVGSIITNLRNYVFATHTSKTLRNLYFRDTQAMIQSFLNATFNVLIRAGLVMYNSVGREDQQEYLEKNLNPGTLITQGIGRANFMGLTTVAADTVVHDLMQRDAIFSGARASSTQPGGVLLGNPAFQWINSTRKAFGSLQAPFMEDYSFSQDDVRNIRNGLFVPDFFGLHRVIDGLSREADLPKRSKPQF